MSDALLRLALLRGEMRKENIDCYIIPTDDYHSSEMVAPFFKAREYVSGFTGSAGTLVVTKDEARLWTDGRYFLQAAEELKDSSIILMKEGEPGVPSIADYLEIILAGGMTVGYDARVMSIGFGKFIKAKIDGKGIKFKTDNDLVARIWRERPVRPENEIWLLEEKYSGKSSEEKLAELRQEIFDAGLGGIVLSKLDDVAWLYNFRGSDIPYTPLALAFSLITTNSAFLYISSKALNARVSAELKKIGVTIRPYEAIYRDVAGFNARLLLDESSANEKILSAIKNPVLGKSPVEKKKAIKNETEVSNIRQAHVMDGIALTKAIYQIKSLAKSGMIFGETELSIEKMLTALRKKSKSFIDLSFESIVATGAHGAIVHYEPTEKTDVNIEPGFLLMDTGAHYLEGTTDVTRTISIGQVTEEMKKHYTAVLAGHLNLFSMRFPKDTLSGYLDLFAREPLHALGLDFNHGTGHGVGYISCVHEGPNAIRKISALRGEGAPLEPNMVTSDEPGLYLENQYGIRIENLTLTIKDGENHLRMVPLTLVPYDRASINPDQLTGVQKMTLNAYNSWLFKCLAPHLSDDEAAWLKAETKPF